MRRSSRTMLHLVRAIRGSRPFRRSVRRSVSSTTPGGRSRRRSCCRSRYNFTCVIIQYLNKTIVNTHPNPRSTSSSRDWTHLSGIAIQRKIPLTINTRMLPIVEYRHNLRPRATTRAARSSISRVRRRAMLRRYLGRSLQSLTVLFSNGSIMLCAALAKNIRPSGAVSLHVRSHGSAVRSRKTQASTKT